jgi:hypothetical protein
VEAGQRLQRRRAAAGGHALIEEGETTMRLKSTKATVAAAAAAMVAVAAAPAAQDGAPVRGIDPATGKPCPKVDRSSHPELKGGCLAYGNTTGIEIHVLTMFGPLRFSRCRLAFEMRVGPRGDAWIEEMNSTNVESPGVCGDALPCRTRDLEQKLPWRGKIVSTGGGRYGVDFDVCFDTCMGRFVGDAAFELERGSGKARRWKLKAEKAITGVSGLQFDGTWSLAPLRVEKGGTSSYFDLRP